MIKEAQETEYFECKKKKKNIKNKINPVYPSNTDRYYTIAKYYRVTLNTGSTTLLEYYIYIL